MTIRNGDTTRYCVDYDDDGRFEECNGEHRPLTNDEYLDNEYYRDGKPLSYAEYCAYYGDPDRHIYLYVKRQDVCPHCDSWIDGDAVYGIDVMDDDKEASCIGIFTLAQLPGHLHDVARDLDADVHAPKRRRLRPPREVSA